MTLVGDDISIKKKKETNKTGLLRGWIPQIEPNHPRLDPRPVHRLRGRHLLVSRHSDPIELDQTPCNLRRLRRPVFLRCVYRSRLRTALHRPRKLQELGRRVGRSLQVVGPVWPPWQTSGQPTRTGHEEDLLDAEGFVCHGHHAGALLHVDCYPGLLLASGSS